MLLPAVQVARRGSAGFAKESIHQAVGDGPDNAEHRVAARSLGGGRVVGMARTLPR
jgi:hypothetical protein